MKRPEWTRRPRKPKTQRPAAAFAPMGDWAKRMHGLTIWLMGVGVLVATGVGFAQSWAGLYGWGVEHGLNEWKATSFPAMVDTFIAIGELGLFALALEGHRLRQSLGVADLLLPLGLASAGWGASLAFNVGHVHGSWTDQLTAGVPPVASMLGLFVLLRTLHRLVARTAPVFQPAPETASHPASNGPAAAGASLAAEPDSATPPSGEAADHEPVLDLPDALRAANRAGWSGRQIAKALGVKNRDPIYAMLRQADPDVDQNDDDTTDTGATPTEGGSEERSDAEYYAGELALDVAKVQAILDNRTDLAPAGAVNGHAVVGGAE